MDPVEDEAASIGSLAERLARLAEKRRRPLRSDSSEGEAAVPPQQGALQALHQLLDARQPAWEGLAL